MAKKKTEREHLTTSQSSVPLPQLRRLAGRCWTSGSEGEMVASIAAAVVGAVVGAVTNNVVAQVVKLVEKRCELWKGLIPK